MGRKIAKEYQNKPCHVCHAEEGTVGHHIITVGSRPDLVNNRDNIIPLCPYHHAEIHRGLYEFVLGYDLEAEMMIRGFELVSIPDGGYKWIWPHENVLN